MLHCLQNWGSSLGIAQKVSPEPRPTDAAMHHARSWLAELQLNCVLETAVFLCARPGILAL